MHTAEQAVWGELRCLQCLSAAPLLLTLSLCLQVGISQPEDLAVALTLALHDLAQSATIA